MATITNFDAADFNADVSSVTFIDWIDWDSMWPFEDAGSNFGYVWGDYFL